MLPVDLQRWARAGARPLLRSGSVTARATARCCGAGPKTEAERTVLELVNLNIFENREVIVQAGAYGEHLFTTVKYPERTDEDRPAAGPSLLELIPRLWSERLQSIASSFRYACAPGPD